MSQWSVVRVTDPAVEALTTTEAKAHLRVKHSDEDTLIGGYSQGWREYLEERTNRSFVLQTLDYFSDDWPDGVEAIEIPRGPVISVTSVKYTTTTSTSATTLSATKYFVDTKSDVGRVALRDGEVWPTNALRGANGVEVRYTAGMATSATGVPQRVKNTLRVLVGHSYSNREAVVVGTSNDKLNLAVDSLVSTYNAKRYM